MDRYSRVCRASGAGDRPYLSKCAPREEVCSHGCALAVALPRVVVDDLSRVFGFRAMRVPPLIWSYWADGFEVAPPLIGLCVDSWRKNSGVSQIRLLDDRNLSEFLTPQDLPGYFEGLPVQQKSDAIRLALLARYGGFWLDASTLITSNIVSWTSTRVQDSGFFAFQHRVGGVGGRAFALGFLAASPGHQFVVEWSASFNKFFSHKRIHYAHSPDGPARKIHKVVFGLLNRHLRKTLTRSVIWTYWPLTALRLYPYFITHCLANRLLVRKDFFGLYGGMQPGESGKYLWYRNELNHGRGKESARKLLDGEIPISDIEFRYAAGPQEIKEIRAELGL